jgi:ankyrin repeat protein
MLPLIKKEIECESNFIQSTERLIQHIVECNFDYLKKLIDSGVDINVKYNNWSLLHYACSMFDQKKYGSDEHLEIIRLLIDSGVPVNSQDEDRWTPLHLACQSGITRVIS